MIANSTVPQPLANAGRKTARRYAVGSDPLYVFVLALASAVACASPPETEPVALDLARFAAVASIDDVCPDTRVDALCEVLRVAHAAEGEAASEAHRIAREALRRAFSSRPRRELIEDPAVRWWIRERGVALLAWNRLARESAPPENSERYASEAGAVLALHFPVYAPEMFRGARVRLPPAAACRGGRVALLFFPGVIRVETLDEFAPARERIESELPCVTTYTAETGTFSTPSENAITGCSVLERISQELPNAAIHTIGYSQGVRNALETFVTCPERSGSVRSLFAMNSAARGSPVADVVALIAPLPGLEDAECVGLDGFAGWWCRNPGASGPGLSGLVAASLRAMGAPEKDPEGVAGAKSGRDYADRRLAGLRSLSTYESQNFWRTQGHALPRDILYSSFRSIITDESQNLPSSDQLFYRSLFLAGGVAPWNDMQVRLIDQHLGGPVKEREIVWPVAEGNHWQWELEPHQIPELLIPAEMLEGIPRVELLLAHIQTLAELGALEGR